MSKAKSMTAPWTVDKWDSIKQDCRPLRPRRLFS